MQTSLLGLGIALILVLVTALVGPIYVDWGQYRSHFEAEATRMVGLPVRIGGKIDVRILPTPSIGLRDVEVGSRAAPVFGAQGAQAELSLGALMRGEWRAGVLTIEAPDVSLALDKDGRVATHAANPAIDVASVSIDRIVVADGTVTFDDAASGTRAVIDKLSFAGDVRSLAGQVRGEGAFASGGQAWRYKLSTGRPGEAGMRVRFNLEPGERPLAYELDGTITFDQGAPRYEGSVAMARPAGVVLTSGKAVSNDPWRVTARAKADLRNILFEQIEAQYGPEERSLRMTGTASLKLGKDAQLNAVLSARQIDLDRALADANASKRLPLAVLRGLGESLGELGRVPVPVSLGLGVDIVTLGGAPLQSVRGDIRSADNAWLIENFEFRAPGYTQVALSGRLEGPQSAVEFSGPVSVESADPRALLTWFEGFERTRNAIGPLRLRGDVTLGKDRVAFERVEAAFDGKSFAGRLAYAFPRDNRPARLDAALTAPEFDIDGMTAFATTAFAGSNFVRPGEIALSADLGRVIFAGIEAGATKVSLNLDGTGLRIDKLSIADFGGSVIDARGAIDIASTPPNGSIALTVDAQRLDGLAALARRYSPQFAAILQRHAANLAPARIEGSVRIDPPATPSGGRALAKLALNGDLGRLRLTATGEGAGDLTAPDKVDAKLRAQISSSDSALLAMLGLDRLLGADKQPATVTIATSGPFGGEMRVEAGLVSEGLDASAKGSIRLSGNAPAGTLALSLTAADIRGLRSGLSMSLPVALRSNLNLAGRPMRFDDLTGHVGDAAVRGKVALTLDPEPRIDGKVSASKLDIPALLASAVGAQVSDGQPWSARPFGGIPMPALRGQIEVDTPQAALSPSLPLNKVRGVVTLAPEEVSFTDVSGMLAGGTATASASFRATPSGVAVQGKVALSNGDAGKIIRNANHAPITGRVSSQIEFEGAGSSPAALVGALRGKGTITLENAQIAALDPKAIDGAIRAVERGTPITAPRIADMVTRVMDAGAMPVTWASAPVEISTGRARLGKLVMPANAGDLGINASLDLVEDTLDARFTVSGQRPSQPAAPRPEVSVTVKGPVAAPRRSVDVSTLVGYLTLQAVDREAKRLQDEMREAERRERLNALIRESAERMASPSAPPVMQNESAAQNQPVAIEPSAPSPPPPVAVSPAARAPAPPAARQPAASTPGSSSRMPPPPRADRQAPRAGVIETAPLPVLPR